ncbi:WGR domain-containing protein [Pseudomonas luteola]
MKVLRKESYVMVDIDGNNNKFWTFEVHDDFTVHVTNGRMDGSGQKQKPKAFNTEYHAIAYAETKIREKLRKGYVPFEGVTNGGSSTSSVSHMDLEMAASRQIRTRNRSQIESLVRFLIEKNVHSILSKTDLSYDSDTGLFKTPMGIVTLSAIMKARVLLGKLSDHMAKQDFTSSEVKRHLADYMMLIPQGAGRKLTVQAIIPDEDAINRQNGILDDLESSIEQLEDLRKKKAIAEGKDIAEQKVFSCEINLCEDEKVISEIQRFYESTRKTMHHLAYRFSIKRVYEVKIDDQDAAFEKDGRSIGNIQRLWHGTRPGNVLSILKNGFVIPPSKAGHVTGRLFGDGVYASDQSTKSLNYACGFWGGGYEPNCFMFLADFAMGRSYCPKKTYEDLPKDGYDSTYVKGGTCGVLNNEMIVYKPSQSVIRYLVEFEA